MYIAGFAVVAILGLTSLILIMVQGNMEAGTPLAITALVLGGVMALYWLYSMSQE